MGSSTLKILREVNNYTQEYLAEKLNVVPNTYAKLEQDPSNLKASQAEVLANLYGVSIADLLANSPPHITFSNNEIEIAYIQNYQQHKEVLDNVMKAKNEEIQSLKQEIDYLRKQNEQLIGVLGQQKN
jgi:transcriptional regulator with XRE-family HTH domain